MLTRPNTRFSGECVYASEHVIYDFTSESETRRSEAESSLFWETPPSASSKSHLSFYHNHPWGNQLNPTKILYLSLTIAQGKLTMFRAYY